MQQLTVAGLQLEYRDFPATRHGGPTLLLLHDRHRVITLIIGVDEQEVRTVSGLNRAREQHSGNCSLRQASGKKFNPFHFGFPYFYI